MFYFPTLSSMFNKNEYKRKVVNKLEVLKDDVDNLVNWNKHYVDECNSIVVEGGDRDNYNKDYLELHRIVNKILKVKED